MVAIAAILGVGAGSPLNAGPEWPTPPPAPRAPRPKIETVTTPAKAPMIAGAALWEIQPIPQGEIPAVPPVRNSTFQVPGQLKLIIEAGTLDRTMQLLYVPVAVDSLPATHPSQRLVKGFDLTFFDIQGQIITPTIRRPLVLEILTDDLPPFGVDPMRLVFARFEEGQWLPLVTTLFRTERRVVVRILKPGRFAVLSEQPLF